jgi:peptidase C13-like protein
MKRFLTIAVLCFFLLSAAEAQKSTGIFVDGGYSPGKEDTDMDKMLDDRIDKGMDAMKKKDPGSDRKKVDNRKALEDALKNLHCKCGDELTLYMVGHGSEDKWGAHAFEFVKDGNSVNPSELHDWIKKATDECCCKIHIVIFSCHSGAFYDELLRDSHVVSIYTSSLKTELSYSDSYLEDTTFHDGDDWIKGFNEDWEKSEKENTGDRLQEASESADDKIPDNVLDKEHPTGWRKGEVEALAHVVGRTVDGKPPKITKLKLHFLKPEFLRCTTREVDVSKVEVSDSVNTCKWVSLVIHTGGPGDKITVDSGKTVTIVEAPTENVLAHVDGWDGKKLKIHIINPKWMYCKRVKLESEKPGVFDKNLKECNWIQVKVKIKDPDNTERGFSTSDTVKPKDQTFRVEVHVEKVGKEKGIIEYHILQPPWLACQNKQVVVPPGERGKLAGIDKCSNLIFDLTFRKDGTDSVSNIKVVTGKGRIRKFALDAAVQRPTAPVLTDSTNTFSPLIGVTNVGTSTVTFPIYVVICKLSDYYVIQNWWRTGEGLPSGVWYNVKNVTELPFAQTRIVNFDTWNVPQGSETYWMGFRTKLNGDQNPSSDTASVVFTVSQAMNHPPILANGYVEPDSGGISTTFTFRVTYTDVDNDPPALKKIFIDSSSYDMIATGNNYSEGVVFGYQTTLIQGLHVFRFSFDDGHGHPVNSQVYTGPIVTSGTMNHAPVLQQGSVMPDSGNYYTPFVYRVLYIDQDNDPPTVFQAFIDNIPFNMNPTGNNFTEGVFFVLQRNLQQGNHNFYFRFDDGHGHMITSQTYTGPIVH